MEKAADGRTEVLNLGISLTPVSAIPNWDMKIWRYMDLAKFVSMLQNRAVYLSVVAELGDDLEAAPPPLPTTASVLDHQKAFSFWSLLRCNSFVNCWHCAEDESAAMWSIYAGRHQGIAIQSTPRALTKAFPVTPEEDVRKMVKIGLVEYIDPGTPAHMPTFLDFYKAVLNKRVWYAHEREMRLIYGPVPNWIEPSSMTEPGRHIRRGVWVPCDLHELVRAVVVGPRARSYLEPVVREILKRFDFDPGLVTLSKMNETVVAPDSEALQRALRSV